MSKTASVDKSGALFDHIKTKKKFTLDSQLAEFIEATKPEVSAIRNGHREISAALLLRICDKTGISLKSARLLIGAAKEGA